MAAIDLKSLVDRLNEPCRRALEAAAGLTVSRTHYNVEIEHWLLRLADPADGDIAAILRHYEVDQSRLLIDLNRALDKMTTGNARNRETTSGVAMGQVAGAVRAVNSR